MSDVTERKNWVEELQRKIFDECNIQSRNKFESVNESSTTSQKIQDVSISIIVRNIQKKFAEIPHFRQRIDFLEELRKSLQKNSRDNNVNWFEFREFSKPWFHTLLKLVSQDGNNNVRTNQRDVSTDNPERNTLLSMEENSCSDTIDDDDGNSYSVNQVDTIASSYSINSSGVEFSATDSIIGSSEEIDHINEDVTGVDLKLRITRINEETSTLRDEVLRLEEANASLEDHMKLIQKKLEQVTDKFITLQKEYDDQKEILNESDQREQLCRQNLRKLEKAYDILQKKVEELEKNKENIWSLKTKLDEVKKDNIEYKKQITNVKAMYDEKVLAYVCLQGQFKELQHNNCQLEKSYEKNFQHQQEKIEELQNLNLELQSKMNKSDNSSQLSLTPPPYNYLSAHIHSTPYSSNKKIRVKDSLYSELKASGFNLDDAQNQDVKEKLIFYKEEIANIINVIDETLKDIATSRNEICVPNLQLMEMDIIENLKYKISTLVNSVKTCATVKESILSSRVDDSREKSDVLAEAKKTSSLVNDRAFTSVKREDDLIGSVTLSVTSMLSKEVHSTCDKSRSSVMETSDCSKNLEAFEPNDDESIEPMSEALNRIIELKGSDNIEEMESVIYPIHKQKSIYTAKNNMDWFTMGSKVTQSSDSSSYINAKGDGPRRNINNTNDSNSQTYQINATSDNLKSAFTKYSSNNDKSVNELDMRYVTLRSIDETYLLNPVVSSSEGNPPGLQQFKTDSRPQVMDYHTPVHNQNQKITPHRKLSVCYPTFGIDSLQIPDSVHNASGEIRHSFAMSNTEGSEYTGSSIKLSIPLESSATRDQLMNSYRCPNNNDSSSSSYSKTDESPVSEPMDDSINEATKMIKKVNLAPSKLQFADSISNQTLPVNGETKNWKTNTISHRNSEFETFSENIAAQQSRILSSSSNLMKANEQREKYNITLDSRNIGGSASFSEFTNDLTNQCLSSNNSVGYENNADNVFLSNGDKNDQTYTKKGVSTEGRRQRAAIVASTTTAALGAAVAAAATAVGVGASTRSCSGEESTTTVGRAMSSGEEEESSAESECEAPRPTSDNTEAEEPALEDKVELIINVNGIDTDNNCQKIISSSPSHDVVKEDESPKAFPSWTDERLQESGIASFPDINSEISENLSEDELKKKYTAFSIGLGTDRMTLSKRMILSRRHRDQAEKNFTNEVSKMQQDIKELAPLCVDSESVERVERVKQQLEMVARCAHRISCSAETLGAVHQERRVSRAVLLADKYMQTLRTKCEKLAIELAETKRILAENNIVLEENLSEMGDDFPRVRYRGVPNNNRTMMARRRASIAAISRPLMGSNQDVSKELPRQRNSVSGRVPGLRRPSLCFETPKWEIEKLDRTDSSSSIAEMREIFEQTESRRHSQEENNNSIRTSIKNLSNTNEYIEGEDHWSNSQEDIVPELSNDNEIISVEIGQNYGHPFVCWLLNRYMTWKPMLWCILIAFLLGFFINRVVSSSRRDGPPLSWWSIEEILNQYIQINNGKHQIPRPI